MALTRAEALALCWPFIFMVIVYFDGWLIERLGLFPDLSWDRSLHLFWMAVAFLEAVVVMFIGAFSTHKCSKRDISLEESEETQ